MSTDKIQISPSRSVVKKSNVLVQRGLQDIDLFTSSKEIQRPFLKAELNWDSLIKEIEKLFGKGKYDQAESVAKKALKIAEINDGPEHFNVALCLRKLAWFYQERGLPYQAEPFFKRSQKIYEKDLNTNHFFVESILFDLARVYYSTNRQKEADAANRRAFEIAGIYRGR